jgi:hypothetical protein
MGADNSRGHSRVGSPDALPAGRRGWIRLASQADLGIRVGLNGANRAAARHTWFSWTRTVSTYFAECDEVWHTGDFGTLEILARFNEFKPTRRVYGNVDGAQVRAAVAEELALGTLTLLSRCTRAETMSKARNEPVLNRLIVLASCSFVNTASRTCFTGTGCAGRATGHFRA